MASRSRKRSPSSTPTREAKTLAALRQIGLELSAHLELDSLLPEIIKSAVNLLDAQPGGGSVCLVNPATSDLEVVAGIGSSAHALGRKIKPNEGLVGRVFASGQPMSVDDYRAWEGHIPEFALAAGETALVAPLRWRDQVIGTLGVESLSGRPFDTDDIRVAELFAAQAALAIGNARLFEAERAGRQRMEAVLHATSALSSTLGLTEVLNSILQGCQMALPFKTASIMAFEGGVPTMAALLGHQSAEDLVVDSVKSDLNDSPILNQMLKDLKPIIIPDVREHPDWIALPGGEHIRAWLGIPLVSRHELIGALMLDSDQVGAYTQEHLEIGQLLAAHATVALENAHLFGAMESALTQIEAYFKASEAIISAADPDALLRVIAGPALRQGDCRAYLLTVGQRTDGSPDWAEMAARVGSDVARVKMGQRFIAQDYPQLAMAASQLKGIVTIPDVEQPHPLLTRSLGDLLRSFDARALTLIPLAIAERWVGLVVLMWPAPHQAAISEEQFYAVIAPQLAAALDNRRLLRETQQAQERFRDMALTATDWLWEGDTDSRITYCSERVVDVLGYAAEEVVGKTPFDFLPARDGRKMRAKIARAAREKQPIIDMEQWIRHKDGHLVCHLVSATPLLGPNGEFLGFRGVSKDITERRRAEQRDRLAFELGQTLTAVLSLDEICKTVVERLHDTFGYYQVELWLFDEANESLLLRREFWSMAPPGIESAMYMLDARPSLVAKAGRTRQTVVSNDTLHDPEFNFVPELPDARSEVTLPLVHRGQLLGVLDVESSEIGYFHPPEVQMLQNLAAQVSIAMANARLYEQLGLQASNLEELVHERTGDVLRERERLRSIVEHAGEGIFFTRADGIVEYVNPAWQRITGLDASKVVGKRLSQILDDQTAQALSQKLGALRAGDSWAGELRANRPDGSQYDAFLRVAPIPDSKGRIGNLVGVMHDITARKQVDRMRSKFVANVSHELRTPITNLKLYHTLIASAPADKLAEYVATMGEQVGRLEKLVEDLLDVSRLDRGSLEIQPELTDLNQILRDSIEGQRLRAERRSIVLSSVLLPDLPPVYVDQKRLTQVAVNLLANAINYTPQGENVGARSWRETADGVEWVAFSVWDTGVGIAPDDLPFIFEPFFRSEQAKQSGTPGTGLGLSIVKEIIELHHGRISVESAPGKGATFTVMLPAYAAPGK